MHCNHTIHHKKHHYGWDNSIDPVISVKVGETIEVLPATFIEAEDFSNRPESELTAEIRGGVKEVEIYAAGSHYSPGQVVTFSSLGGVTSTAEIIKVSNNFSSFCTSCLESTLVGF